MCEGEEEIILAGRREPDEVFRELQEFQCFARRGLNVTSHQAAHRVSSGALSLLACLSHTVAVHSNTAVSFCLAEH